MSSYFDELSTELNSLFKKYTGLDDFREPVASVKFFIDYRMLEEQVIKTVSLCTGDREFPDDLREKIQGIIAVKRVFGVDNNPNEKNLDMLLAVKNSELLSSLHSAFHEVASKRIATRFGLLSDNPDGILKRRDFHDVEGHE